MKVLVTGAGGQLGTALQAAFGHCDLMAADRSSCDVTDPVEVRDILAAHAPDVVVNAAAYTAVDACESDPEPAWAVNAAGAGVLARECSRADAALVHVSTDYVFPGTLERPYTEFDATGPQSVYGRTKEAGEQLVRAHCPRHYVVRTAWLQGEHGGNFVKTMLRLGRERDRLGVVDDQLGTPTFADDLAARVHDLVETGRYGTYHLAGSGACTWYELAGAVFEMAGIDVDLEPIDTATFGAAAPRPPNSRLEGRNAAFAGIAPLPHWRDSLASLVKRLTA